jgi:ATPase subunit of ABC transporter with duplicated ATPase domains
MLYSHDYETINTVATRIIEFKDDGIYDFSGTYEEYLAYKKEKGLI